MNATVTTQRTVHIWSCDNCGYESQPSIQVPGREYACGVCGAGFTLSRDETEKILDE